MYQTGATLSSTEVSSANESAVTSIVRRHALLEISAIVATVHHALSLVVDVEVLADASTASVTDVVNDSIFILVAGTLCAVAAANHAHHVQLFHASTHMSLSKRLVAIEQRKKLTAMQTAKTVTNFVASSLL